MVQGIRVIQLIYALTYVYIVAQIGSYLCDQWCSQIRLLYVLFYQFHYVLIVIIFLFRPLEPSEANRLRTARLGFIFSLIVHTNKPQIYNFWQSCMSVEMWREGCPLQLFHAMNFLGVTQCKATARAKVDKICTNFDHEIRTWKTNVEVCL